MGSLPFVCSPQLSQGLPPLCTHIQLSCRVPYLAWAFPYLTTALWWCWFRPLTGGETEAPGSKDSLVSH